MKKYSLLLSIMLLALVSQAQIDPNFWKGYGQFSIGGGAAMPLGDFSENGENGMFAEDGFEFLMEYNYHLPMGFALGGGLEVDGFKFDTDAYLDFTGADEVFAGRWTFTKLGGNLQYKIPVVFMSGDFVFNLYGEANGGVRFVSMPDIELTYPVTVNRYSKVYYREGSGTFEYYGYSLGAETIFNEKWGFNVGYNQVYGGKRKVTYVMEGVPPQEDAPIVTETDFVGQTFNHYGIQVALTFYF